EERHRDRRDLQVAVLLVDLGFTLGELHDLVAVALVRVHGDVREPIRAVLRRRALLDARPERLGDPRLAVVGIRADHHRRIVEPRVWLVLLRPVPERLAKPDQLTEQPMLAVSEDNVAWYPPSRDLPWRVGTRLHVPVPLNDLHVSHDNPRSRLRDPR